MNCELPVLIYKEVCSTTDQAAIIRDFQRDVYCLFGLPVDNLTLVNAKALVRESASMKENLVLSTININWVVRSFTDSTFRDGILNSDFVTLDGKPLVWLARFLGYPMQDTVAGSTLIEELRDKNTDQPLTIFLFGGDGNAAECAKVRLNELQAGLRAVGAVNPGYGSVKEMSTAATINSINSTSPDILLVALGAAKGVAWIEANRHQLNAGIISHLGATVNFLAGTIRRAPKFMQEYGLEWLWRILQEPKMFFRYANDGLVLARVLLCCLPVWLRHWFWKQDFDSQQEGETAGHWQKEGEKTITITLGRNPKVDKNSPLRALLCRAALACKDLTLDFQATEHVTGDFLGMLLILQKHQRRQGLRLMIRHLHGRAALMFQLYGLNTISPGGEF